MAYAVQGALARKTRKRELKACKIGHVRNSRTNRCRKAANANKPVKTLAKPCKDGWERYERTNRCRKISLSPRSSRSSSRRTSSSSVNLSTPASPAIARRPAIRFERDTPRSNIRGLLASLPTPPPPFRIAQSIPATVASPSRMEANLARLAEIRAKRAEEMRSRARQAATVYFPPLPPLPHY
jgi:hypothetical protein